MMKNKILVTGGAGLIGSNVVSELNRMGEKNIVVADHLGTSEKWKNLRRISFRDYIEKDVLIQKVESGKFL
ncbi:MAG: NAD-dependent epimerase/dehydratase family protein, partial [Leptospira sp.]|nr:NAD-dependent epimerase/dehydratase family protein [Leptospira sp.]